MSRTSPYAAAVLLAATLTQGCGGTGSEGGEANPTAAPAITAAFIADITADTLRAAVITERVLDDSDDPAIWVNPDVPSGSLVLGTDKNDGEGGIYVFGMDGRIDRARTMTGLRRVNNVDVIQGVTLNGRRVDLAAATERSRMALRVLEMPAMEPVDNGGIHVFDGDSARAPMGVALYRRPSDGSLYAFVGGKGGPPDGYIWQYRLEADAAGVVRGTVVRRFGQFSGAKEIEAIAVDPDLGYVYYSDETAGVRKYHADPDSSGAELAFFGREGFVQDHEGIAIYRRPDGTGYILVSDQQGNRLQVFPREGSGGDPHHHPVVAVIPVSARDTDGLEVTHMPVGERFPHGLLVLMSSDGTFHLYRWDDVQDRIDAVRQ